MARIAGLDLPRQKPIHIALTYIYGIGRTLSTKILQKLNILATKRVQDLNEEEISKLRDEVEKSGLQVEGDLRRVEGLNVKRLISSSLRS